MSTDILSRVRPYQNDANIRYFLRVTRAWRNAKRRAWRRSTSCVAVSDGRFEKGGVGVGWSRPAGEAAVRRRMDVSTAAALLDIRYPPVDGVGPESVLRAAKSAYRRLALRHHPDKNGGRRSAQLAFVKVGIAYRTVVDSVRGAHPGEFGDGYIDEDDIEVRGFRPARARHRVITASTPWPA